MDKKVMLNDLESCVKSIGGNTIFHIGSGAGFLFIGTEKEFEIQMPGISEKLLLDAKRLLKKYKKKEKSLEEKYRNGYLEKLKKNDKKVKCLFDQTSMYEKYIMDFVPIKKRPVKEIYPRISKDGIVILVDGVEIGRYWMRSEVNSKISGGKTRGLL